MLNAFKHHEVTQAIANGQGAKWAYISTIYSLFYFFPIISQFGSLSTSKLITIVILYVCFLACYFKGLNSFGNKSIQPILATFLIAFIGSNYTGGTSALFGYGAFLCSYYFRVSLAIWGLLIAITTQLLAAYVFNMWSVYFIGPAVLVSIGLFIFGHFARREYLFKCREHELIQEKEHLVTIAERERIARDMHDLLGHSLSSIALKSELAEKLIAKQKIEQAANEMREVAELSRQALSDVRHAITGMNQKDIAQALNGLIQQLENLGFTVEQDVELPVLEPKIESTLILVLKEAVTNILRHSRGDHVSLFIHTEMNEASPNPPTLIVAIGDNGMLVNRKINEGNGLLGIKKRIESLQGQLVISTENGVKLKITLPINLLSNDTEDKS